MYSYTDGVDEGELSVKDINHAVTQVMLIIKNSLSTPKLAWMYNVSGKTTHLHILLLLVFFLYCRMHLASNWRVFTNTTIQ